MNSGTLRLLLHKYCFPAVVPFQSVASLEFIEECYSTLVQLGLIEHAQDYAEITEKGRVHVEALLDAPLPKKCWISPISELTTAS